MDKTPEPVLIQRTNEPREKVHLFSIVEDDGEETKYYIPKKAPYNLTLGILEVAAQRGELAATVFAMKETLGEDGYNALLDCDDLEEEDFEKIADIVQEVTMGANKGKLNRASRRALQRSRG